MMKDKFELKSKGNCGCHPETCCCNDYKIVTDETEVVATGNCKELMKNLVLWANYGYLQHTLETIKDSKVNS